LEKGFARFKDYGAMPEVGKLYAELEPAFAVSDTCDLIT
jgi:hypothetical protein